MKLKALYTAVVLALCILLCICSMHIVFGALDEAERLGTVALEQATGGDLRAARATLASLALAWQRQEPLLEMLTNHGDLRDVVIQYTQAATSLDHEHLPDFYQAMAQLSEALNHLRAHESLNLSNLF